MNILLISVLFGLLLLFLGGHALFFPLKLAFKLGMRFLMGGLLLFLLNFIAAGWGWNIGVNIGSILIVGFLGFPGILFLVALKHIFS